MVKDGWFGASAGFHARVEIQRVERYANRAVLRFTVTSLESASKTASGAFGIDPTDRNTFRIALVDPVGRKMYRPVTTPADTTPGEYRPRRGARDGRVLPADSRRRRSDHGHTARGKGEADPVAKEGGADDAAARSRNRRVEISYQVRRQTPGSTTTATAPAQGRGGAVAPARFRPRDGATVASRFGRFGQAKRRIDVKPFYRDGAYLVAVFDIVNLGPGTTPPDASYGHKDYVGGDFMAFSVIDPAGQDVYRAVRVGPGAGSGPSAYVEPGRATFRTEVDAPVRGFFYVPAQPGNVRSVIFDGRPFGKVADVPVS